MLSEFLLGGKAPLAARAGPVSLAHVYRPNVGAEVAPGAKRCSALIASKGETPAVGISAARLIRLAAAKVTQPLVVGCGAERESAAYMEPSAAEAAAMAFIVTGYLLVAPIATGSGHCVQVELVKLPNLVKSVKAG